MRYAVARFNQDRDALVYRIYITDAMKTIGRLDKRFADIISVADYMLPAQAETTPEDAQEVISGICNKLAAFETKTEPEPENEEGKEEK